MRKTISFLPHNTVGPVYVCTCACIVCTEPAATFQPKHTHTNHEKIALINSGTVLVHSGVLVNEEFVHHTE